MTTDTTIILYKKTKGKKKNLPMIPMRYLQIPNVLKDRATKQVYSATYPTKEDQNENIYCDYVFERSKMLTPLISQLEMTESH